MSRQERIKARSTFQAGGHGITMEEEARVEPVGVHGSFRDTELITKPFIHNRTEPRRMGIMTQRIKILTLHPYFASKEAASRSGVETR
eukprot:4288945-Pyramimonas_sp.AAC.1